MTILNSSEAVEILVAGYALLRAQTYVATNVFFGETEIRRFVRQREKFHELFSEACGFLADEIAEGDLSASLMAAVPPLRMAARSHKEDSRKIMLETMRAFRSFRVQSLPDATPAPIMRLVANAHLAMREDHYGIEQRQLFERVLRSEVVPSGIKTILRQIVKLPQLATPLEDVDPGAWFSMSADEQAAIRAQLSEVNAEITATLQIVDSDERWDRYKQLLADQQNLIGRAGVPPTIIQQVEATPVKVLLRQEADMVPNGPCAYMVEKLTADLAEEYEFQSKSRRKSLTKAQLNEMLRDLSRAKTTSTVGRVIQDAVARGVLSSGYGSRVDQLLQQVSKNKCVADGIPMQPLVWAPISVADFTAKYGISDWDGVRFDDSDFPQEQQEVVLGKVSRAIDDLELVFGQGLCTIHKKPLRFRFGGVQSGALASYYMYERNQFQPHVTFGKEFAGLLAHELSHYYDDALGYLVAKDQFPSTTGGTLFVNTGVPLSYFRDPRTTDPMRKFQKLPEMVDLINAILDSPDYKRWDDYLPAAYESVLTTAIANITGAGAFYSERNRAWADARFKSELPPEIVTEADRLYSDLMDGDTRKLSYTVSGVEVWARMCEQYVYTRLARVGISNPWLTQLSYDGPTFMDQDRFESILEPIFDRIFARLEETSRAKTGATRTKRHKPLTW